MANSGKGLELVHVELKRDTWLAPEKIIQTPKQAAAVFREWAGDLDREMTAIFHCTAKGQVISASVCSIGTMDMALVSPREIFRTALMAGAHSILLAHNHPSGDATPSRKDMEATRRVSAAGQLLGIPLLDSVVAGSTGYFSFRESAPVYLSGDPLSREMAVSELKLPASGPEQRPDKSSRQKVRTRTEEGYQRAAAARREVVDTLIDIIRQGKTFYDPLWNHAAMSPRNPISHVTYKGGNRMILMLEVMKNGYRDPRWMTYKQLSEKGYYVKKGEHGTRLEKWIFSKWMRAVDEHGIPKSDADGKPIYEEYLLQSPIYNTFVVFNGEQVQDFPVYQPVNPSPGQTEQKVNALIRSSACRYMRSPRPGRFTV